MSGPLTGQCPECQGPRMVGHPLGFVWQHQLTCDLLRAEDATLAADCARAARRGLTRRYRPTTEAERTLLGALGVELPAASFTRVDLVSPGARRRAWKGVVLDPDQHDDDPAWRYATLDLDGEAAS